MREPPEDDSLSSVLLQRSLDLLCKEFEEVLLSNKDGILAWDATYCCAVLDK